MLIQVDLLVPNIENRNEKEGIGQVLKCHSFPENCL